MSSVLGQKTCIAATIRGWGCILLVQGGRERYNKGIKIDEGAENTMIECRAYGTTHKGQQVRQYLLKAGPYEAGVLDYGGRITHLLAPDCQGRPVDVVLGCDDLAGYEADTVFLGAVVGRVANRIEKGRFALDGKEYQLDINNGPNHNHGVWHQQVWQAQVEADALVLCYHSPDGEDGLPGNVQVQVRYTLNEQGELRLEYTAVSDAATPINLTNHSYFNLSGCGDVLDHEVRLWADHFTRADENSCPYGTVDPVQGTPMDFTAAKPIGQDIEAPYDQLEWGKGYDHNWCVAGSPGTLRPAAWARSPQTGITLLCSTTQPGIQFYTGNWLPGTPGKGGVPLKERTGFCFETQHWPCAVNRPSFPSVILRPGQKMQEVTVFQLGCQP